MKNCLIYVILLAISHVTVAEVSTSDINKYLPGNWQSKQEISGQRIESKTVYGIDGKVTYELRIISPQGTFGFEGEGKWKVEGDSVVVTVTKSSSPDFLKIGDVMKDKVTFIDSNQFSYVDEEGTAITEYRK
jgi:hypothetical protein